MVDYPSLLVTKITVPGVRPSQVERPQLLSLLDRGLAGKLILVAAAAGFGKTTLVASWCITSPAQVGWVSLDEGDNDPVRFLSYLITAVQQSHPDFGLDLLAALQAPQPPSLENSLYTLVSQLAGLNDPLILCLDDYHVIDNTAVQESLAFLLEQLPPQITIVLLSRSDPALPLARLRARNELVELRAADLRFSEAESVEFLNQTMGLDLAVSDIQTLERQTEGWIAGLQLAAVALQSLTIRREEFIKTFSGSHRFVLDYLMEEVLENQPAEVRDFLLKTSILHRLSTSLCDAVTDKKGHSKPMLDYLEQHNLFLVPLDHERHWYRYHHLFGDLLQARLFSKVDEDVLQLKRRAAEWHEANHLPEEAVGYAFEAEDYDYAVELIMGPARLVFQRGEVSRLLGWVKQLPGVYLENNPYLCLQFGLAFALNGRWPEAERLLGQVEAANSEEIETADLIMLAFLVASHQQDMAALQAIVEKTAKIPQPNPLTKTVLALIHFLVGDSEGASDLLGQAQMEAELEEDWATAFNALLQHCRLQVYRGMLHEAHHLCQLALERAQYIERGAIAQVSLAYSVLGRIYIEWDEPRKAADYLNNAIDSSQKSGFLTGMLSSSTIMVAEVYDALGRQNEMEETAETALARAARHDPPAEVEWLKTYQARLWLNQGNLSAAVQWLETLEKLMQERPLPVSIFYPNQIRDVTKARILLAQRKRDEAISILTTLTAKPPTLLTVEAFALLGLARQANRDSVNAHLALEQALTMAESEKRIRLFLNLGRPMFHLLESFHHQLSQSHQLRPFVEQLLKRFPNELGDTAQIDPLSDRELEVLTLIVAGQSNQEIADNLFLALSTVKWYINTIYAKLRVKSRSQAIAKTHQLNILSTN